MVLYPLCISCGVSLQENQTMIVSLIKLIKFIIVQVARRSIKKQIRRLAISPHLNLEGDLYACVVSYASIISISILKSFNLDKANWTKKLPTDKKAHPSSKDKPIFCLIQCSLSFPDYQFNAVLIKPLLRKS